MTPCKKSKFYLNNGRLDLSSLSEDITINEKQENEPQIEDHELVELQSDNITATLEEMALMFEEESDDDQDTQEDQDSRQEFEDEFKKAFNSERIQQEMKEFRIDK